MKLTVNEYAREFKTSVQSVYQRIKRGTLKSVEENGTKYVVVEQNTIKPEVENPLNEAFKMIKRLQKQLKTKDKEIKRLTKKNEKQNKFLIGKYENALPKPKKDNITDIKPVKKRKKKK